MSTSGQREASSYRFLIICAVIMMTGVLILAWLGSPPINAAAGKPLPMIKLTALANVESDFDNDSLKGHPTVIYLWAPNSDSSSRNLKRLAELITKHPEYSVLTVAFSEGSSEPSSLRERSLEQLNAVSQTWPVFVDDSGQASMEFALLMPYGSFGFPTLIVVDSETKIVDTREIRRVEDWEFVDRKLSQSRK